VGFIFLKIVQRLILPPASPLLLMLIGLLLVRSRRNLGRLFIATGFLLLYGLSINPVSSALIAPLEEGFRPANVKLVKADVIVVLGGGAIDRSWLGLDPEPGEGSTQRVAAGIKLYRVLHVPVLLSGGSGDPAQPQLSDADAMARTAIDLGVPEKDIIIENKSRNTLESARAVKGMLKGNRIFLVTSAYHMKRSVAMFKKQGFEVVPAPAGYRAERRPATFLSFIPNAASLSTSAVALSEDISFLWYSMTGGL
jgi:uncharacterized SAM-binding protein YcdF (DUF218 family)